MSMTTMGKKKMNRWQAALLAGVVLAGGALAVPQAASAASGTKTCGNDGYSCSTTVTAKKGHLSFRVVDAPYTKGSTSYTVKMANGSKLCSGKITFNGASKTCSTYGYKGKVTISVSKGWSSGVRILSSY